MLSEKRSLNTYLFASTLLHHITIKNLILTIALFTTLVTSNILFSQTKRVAASARRAEYIEVEKGVKLPPRSRANPFAWFYNLKY